MRVGIIGTGAMGRELARTLSRVNVELYVLSRLPERARQIVEELGGRRSKGAGQAHAIESTEGLAICDLVIECVPDVLVTKRRWVQELLGFVSSEAVLWTSTSSLKVCDIFPDFPNALGVHFFRPVGGSRVVELVYGDSVQPQALELTMKLLESLNKKAYRVPDTPGFLVNLHVVAYLNEAALMLEQGYSPVAIEKAASEVGFRCPPFRLMTYLGSSLCMLICTNISSELPSRFSIADIVPRMFEELEGSSDLTDLALRLGVLQTLHESPDGMRFRTAVARQSLLSQQEGILPEGIDSDQLIQGAMGLTWSPLEWATSNGCQQ